MSLVCIILSASGTLLDGAKVVMLGGCCLSVSQVFADDCAEHNNNFHHSDIYGPCAPVLCSDTRTMNRPSFACLARTNSSIIRFSATDGR